MGLDAYVICNCARDGKAKPHPFPERMGFDDTGEPILGGSPSLEDWLVHDRWQKDSCEHGGTLMDVRLGNIAAIAYVRDELKVISEREKQNYPLLSGKVVYNGVHSGDWIAVSDVPALLDEVESVLSVQNLSNRTHEFCTNMRRLCEASIATSNPITF